jgi:hypothetical protein
MWLVSMCACYLAASSAGGAAANLSIAATQPQPRAGVEVALERWKGDIAKMRYLAGNPEAVPKRVALAASKEVLWTLGQAIEAEIAGAWRPLLPPDRIWDTLASMADHKMTGQQLERLYRTMKEQGYKLPLVKALPDDQVPSGEGPSAFRSSCFVVLQRQYMQLKNSPRNQC